VPTDVSEVTKVSYLSLQVLSGECELLKVAITHHGGEMVVELHAE